MKHNFLAYFFIIMFFQNTTGAQRLIETPEGRQKLCNKIAIKQHTQLTDTPEERQKLRNQIAFEYICANGINPINEKLIDDGSIDFNFPYGDFKRTQLSIAARSSQFLTIDGGPIYNPHIIEWLIDHRANPHILDDTGRSAALWSIGSFQGENEHPIKLFFKKNPVNINQVFDITNIGDALQSYQPKVTLLTAAVLTTWQMYGDDYSQAWYNLVRTLLKFNPDRNIAPNGKTALQIAEAIGDEEMIKILKEQ